MTRIVKRDFPVERARHFLEPGPIVLVSSAWKEETNIMTMGWHMIMGTEPSLIGCYIWTENYSFDLIKKSKECVINLPTHDMADKVVAIGNSSGREIDKFETYGLTPQKAKKVKAPLIKECFANFECKVVDTSQVAKYSLFILEVVKAHAKTSPKNPKTIHYRGQGLFMVSGSSLNLRKGFKPEMLEN